MGGDACGWEDNRIGLASYWPRVTDISGFKVTINFSGKCRTPAKKYECDMYNCVLTAGYGFRELNFMTPQIQNVSDIFHLTLTEVMYKSIFPTLLSPVQAPGL